MFTSVLPVSSSPLQFRNQSKPNPNPKSPNYNLSFASGPSTVKLRAGHSPNPVPVIPVSNTLAYGDDGHWVFNNLQYFVDRPDKNSASKPMRRTSFNGKGKLDEDMVASMSRLAGKEIQIDPDEDFQGSHIPGLGSAGAALLQEVEKAHPNGPKLLVKDCHLGSTKTKLGTRGPFLHISESVTEGHPDKLCDQISDKVVDACLEQDPESKVACETWTKNNKVRVVGKITSRANLDYEKLVHDTCRNVGYDSDVVVLDADCCKVELNQLDIEPYIVQGVYRAGGRVLVFGYATDETAELMPLGQVVANKATARMDRFRKEGNYPWLGPAGKALVTCEYSNVNGAMVPIRICTVDVITQHNETVTKDEIEAEFMESVIKPVIPKKYLNVDEKINFNLIFSNKFVPCGYAGHTGRQIMADNYGGLVPLVGGYFSGKDSTKVERCGAYIARQAAKSIVANKLAKRCVVYVLYAIVEPEPEPLSVTVDTYETGKYQDRKISEIVKKNFDFRPGMIAINLDLKRGGNGRFSKTAVHGHFGRVNDPDFTWEAVKSLA